MELAPQLIHPARLAATKPAQSDELAALSDHADVSMRYQAVTGA